MAAAAGALAELLWELAQLFCCESSRPGSWGCPSCSLPVNAWVDKLIWGDGRLVFNEPETEENGPVREVCQKQKETS